MATIYQRNKTWWIQYYISGKRFLKSLRTSDDREAKKLKKDLEAKLTLHMVSAKTQRIKIADALQNFILYKKPAIKASTTKRYQQLIANLVAFFATPQKTYIQDLRDADLNNYANKRQGDGVSGKTIFEELTILKSTIEYCVKQRQLQTPQTLTWPKIKKITAKPETIDRYSAEEIAKIKDHFRKREEYDYMLGLIYLGCRRSELWDITRADVDFTTCTVRLQNLKTATSTANQFRKVEIHDELLEMLRHRCEGKKTTEKILPIKGTGVWLIHALRRACKKLEIPYRRLHGFRHSFISALLNSANVTQFQVMAMVGHTNLSTTMKYSHISSNDLKGKIKHLGY